MGQRSQGPGRGRVVSPPRPRSGRRPDGQRVTWAADGIAKLAENAESESVKLAALRAILSDMMAVSEFAGLEDRMTRARGASSVHGTGNTGRAG